MIEKNHPVGGRSPDDITGEKTPFIYLLNTFKVAATVTTNREHQRGIFRATFKTGP